MFNLFCLNELFEIKIQPFNRGNSLVEKQHYLYIKIFLAEYRRLCKTRWEVGSTQEKK